MTPIGMKSCIKEVFKSQQESGIQPVDKNNF